MRSSELPRCLSKEVRTEIETKTAQGAAQREAEIKRFIATRSHVQGEKHR